MLLLFDRQTGEQIGASADRFATGDDVIFIDEQDTAAMLPLWRKQTTARIKEETRAKLVATDWRLERAKEREFLAVGGESVAQVLALRESIRRAGNRAEQEAMALTSQALLQAFTWEVTAADRLPATVLTPLQFLRRFTAEERAKIKITRTKNPQLEDYFAMLEAALRINLADEDIITGVNLLEKAQLIARGRAAEILQTEETPS